MNAKEGMRRLGVLAGLLGACVGSYISYRQVRILLRQSSEHEEFQSLAASPVVQREVLFLKNNLTISQATHDAIARDTPATTTKPTDSPSPPSGTVWSEAPLSIYVEDHHGQGWFDAVGAIGGFNGWRIDEGEVKTIYFGQNGELKAIEKEDGVTITASSGLRYWPYLLAMMPSILGFLLPWGSLAVLTWIGTGFFRNSK